jgi:hypothetical protein
MTVDKTMWVQRAKVLALYVLVVLVVASIGVLLEAKPAHAKTFTVDSTGDALDVSPPTASAMWTLVFSCHSALCGRR